VDLTLRAGARLWPQTIIVALCAACLAFLLLVNFGWIVSILVTPREAMYHEAVVYDHAARILRGEPLYQPLESPPYTIALYTPVYYHLAAGLRGVFGPGFGPGRGLSVVAGLVAAGLVAWLTTGIAGDRRAGLFAAALFLALGLPGVQVVTWEPVWPWLAFYKEDMLGAAFALAAIAALAWRRTPSAVMLAAALAALAFLTKQTFVAASLAGAGWLWSQDRRHALRFVAVWIVLVGSVVAVETLTEAFVANVVLANVIPFRWAALLANMQVLAACLTGPLLVAGAFAVGTRGWRTEPRSRLLVLYWGCTALPLVGLGKLGSNYNYWIEFAAATAMVATLGLWTWLRGARARALWLAVGLLALQLEWLSLLAAPTLRAQTRGWSAVLHPDSETTAAWQALVARVGAEPRIALANPLDVIALADRPIELEPYTYNLLASEGRWDPTPLVDAICNGTVGLLVLAEPLETLGDSYHGYAVWPAPVLTALRATMQLDTIQAGRYVYLTRANGGATDCAR
jgi:hypothetical protein